MDFIINIVASIQQWLFEIAVQPALFHLGLSNYIEDAYDATMWLLVGIIQIAIIICIFLPLEYWRPVEKVTDKQQVRVDIFYTLIHRLGLFRLGLFFAIYPIIFAIFGYLNVRGFQPFYIDQLWLGVTDNAWVSLIIYLIIFDAVDYFYHRAQHRFKWLWELHAVHHSQRQLTIWSDNRNHLLDDAIRATLIIIVSQCIGVPPQQFVIVVAITQLIETFSHANARINFGRFGQYLVVDPRFHRHHHSIDFDPTTPSKAGGNNFAILFPIWDVLFGTAKFVTHYAATGIHDQLQNTNLYGKTFFAQQWLGLKRMFLFKKQH